MRLRAFLCCGGIILVSLALAACAKRATPTGGPKDEKPPVMVGSEPENGTTNFKGNSFIVTFDEYVSLNQLNEKFMVSPPLEKRPNIYLRGKNLHVDFPEQLKDSTTYTFYFQDAVRDLNEGNPYNNFQFVFSTGNVLDSLSVTGNILMASDLEAGENVLVMLYSNTADSAPRKLIPDYITLADHRGQFRIDNIKGGKYRINGLIDINNNKKYDLSDEIFAFADTIININSWDNYIPAVTTKVDSVPTGLGMKAVTDTSLNKGQFSLYLFTAPPKTRYLKSSDRSESYLLSYILSLPPDSLNFGFRIDGTDEGDYFLEPNQAGDTILVWLQDTTLISKQLIESIVEYPFTDSTGAVVLKTDTIPMRYIVPRAPRISSQQNPYKINNSVVNGTIKPGQEIAVISPTPFRTPDTSRIRLYETDGKERKMIAYSVRKDTTSSRRYFISGSFTEETRYVIIADSGSFGSIYGETADSLGIPFTVRPRGSFGNLILNISNGEGDLVFQLLDEKEKLLATRRYSGKGNVQFRLLEKGKYKLRVIYDLNGDGKWTTGDYDLGIQPEPVSYLGKIVDIMVNWDNQESWDVGDRNVKSADLKLKK